MESLYDDAERRAYPNTGQPLAMPPGTPGGPWEASAGQGKPRRTRKSIPKHWYMIYGEECVLCGSHEEWRERKYTPRPDDPYQRHHFEQYACGHHFC